MRTDGLQEKTFAGAVASYQEAEARSAVCDQVEIGEQCTDLGLAAHRDIRQADTRHHAAFK